MPLPSVHAISLVFTALAALMAAGTTRPAEVVRPPGQEPAGAGRTGVPSAAVRVPVSRLRPDHAYEVKGAPGAIAIDEHVWIANGAVNGVVRIDPAKNVVVATIAATTPPCSGLAAGFGAIWVPGCGGPGLSRIDVKTGTIAAFPLTTGGADGSLASGAGSIWMMTDAKGTLARIDPDTNKVVAEIYLPAGSSAVAFGEDAVWVTSTDAGVLTRVNAHTNVVEATIKVGRQPGHLAVGEGSVWTFNQADGTVTRVDVKTGKVTATIGTGLTGSGDIAVGEGSVWVTAAGFPLTRISPETNTVVQQFVGAGGGAVRLGHGALWLSNTREGTVWRLDPKRIEATLPEGGGGQILFFAGLTCFEANAPRTMTPPACPQ